VRIASIVEPFDPKESHQPITFAFVREVGRAIAGQDGFEPPERLGYFKGQLGITRCGKHQTPPVRVLRGEIVEKGRVVGQHADLNRGALSDLPLQVGFAEGVPPWAIRR
jgi:hypothetical protein